MALFEELLIERDRENQRRAMQGFEPGERERHLQAQATIGRLYAALTAEQEPADGPAVSSYHRPHIEQWYQPTHIERRVVDEEAFEVFAQLGHSHAIRVL